MKRIFINLLLLLILLPLGSCASLQQNQSAASKPLVMEYTFWWGDFTLLVAQKKGFFQKYGVTVQPVYYPVFSEVIPDLAAGQVDAGFMAMGDVMSVNRHRPLKVIAIEDDGSYMPIVARPEYTSVISLKGKTIGVMLGTQYEMLVTEMLANANINPSDVFITQLNPEDAAQALKNNTVQAAFVWEPFTSQAISQGNHVIFPVDQSQRLFPDALVFQESVVRQRPDDIRNFLRAWFEAIDYRTQHPDETRQIAAEFLGVAPTDVLPDPNLKVMSLGDNNELFQRDTGGSIFETSQRTGEYLLNAGVLAKLPDFNTVLDSGFLPSK